MRNPAALIAIAMGVAAPGTAMASSSSGGYVRNLSVGNDGWVWFAYTGTHWGGWPSYAETTELWIIGALQSRQPENPVRLAGRQRGQAQDFDPGDRRLRRRA